MKKRYQLTLEWDQLWFLQVWQNIGCGPTYPYIQLSNPDCIQNQLSHNSLQKIFIQERRLEAGSHFWRACPPSGGRSIGRLPNPAPFEFKPPAPPVNREGAHAANLQFYLSPWISNSNVQHFWSWKIFIGAPHIHWVLLVTTCTGVSWIHELQLELFTSSSAIFGNIYCTTSGQVAVLKAESFHLCPFPGSRCSSNLLALRLSSLSSGGVLSLTWLSVILATSPRLNRLLMSRVKFAPLIWGGQMRRRKFSCSQQCFWKTTSNFQKIFQFL